MDSISIVMPAYNEETRIESSLMEVSSHLAQSGREYEIVVVDDGSSDTTRQRLETLTGSMPQLIVVSYSENRGKGCAVRRGVASASKATILMTDADLSAPIDQLPKLERALEMGFDIAIGSREAPGAFIPVRQPAYRKWGGRGLNLLIRIAAVPGIYDTQCGFKLFKAVAAKAVFEKCVIDGFGFDVETLYLARKLGYSIKEVGVTWSHCEGSKVRPLMDGLRLIRDVARIRSANYSIKG